MKSLRILLLIIIFVSIQLEIIGQNSFKVYNTDGSIDVIFYNTLDSIVYKTIQEENYLLQEIHTVDSVYSYSIDKIDSITFTKRSAVFKDNAIDIDKKLRDYIVCCDSLSLYLNRNVPDNVLPKPQDNLVTLVCDSVLPNGFIGQVLSIERTIDYVIIDCTHAALVDVFEYLDFEASVVNDLYTDIDVQRKQISAYNDFLNIPSLKQTFDLSDEVSAGNLSGEYDMTSFIEMSTTKYSANISLIIEPQLLNIPKVCFSFTSIGEHELSFGGSICSTGKFSKNIPVVCPPMIRIPHIPFVALYQEGGIYLDIDGSLGINCEFHKPFKTITHYSFDNYTQSSVSPSFKIIGSELVHDMNVQGSANFGIGLYYKTGLTPYVSDLAELGIDLKLGALFSSSMDIDIPSVPITMRNTEIYEMLNKDDFFRGDVTVTSTVKARLLDDSIILGSASWGDLLVKNPFLQYGIVPIFSNMKLEKTMENGSITAMADVSRNVLFPVKVGFAVYNEMDELIDSWWSPEEYQEDNLEEEFKISHTFENLETDNYYTVHPLTCVLNNSIVATPSHKISLYPSIITQDAVNITPSSARLLGETNFSEDINVEEIGFVYYQTYNADKKFSINIDCENGEVKADITGLENGVSYSFYAYAKINGKIELGKTKCFNTLIKSQNIGVEINDIDDVSSSKIKFYISTNAPSQSSYDIGFLYCDEGTDYIQSSSVLLKNWGSTSVFYAIDSLKSNTKYHCCAFIRIGDEIAYSNPIDVRTLRYDDAENPIFRIDQNSCNSNSPSTRNKYPYIRGYLSLAHCNAESLDNYVIDKKFKAGQINYQNNMQFDDEYGFYHQYTSYYLSVDSNNYYINVAKPDFALIKFAYEENPNDWHYTKIPINLYYEKSPQIKLETDGANIEAYIEGAYWIESLQISVSYWRKGYNGTQPQLISSETIEKNVNNGGISDTNKSVINNHRPSSCDYVVIHDASATLSNGEPLNVIF